MVKITNILGVVLAGGLSSRMGEDKSELLFREQKLIRYSINALKPFCAKIVISSNSNKHQYLGYPIISDNYHNIGPIAGLQAVLSESKYNHIMVLPCDSPLVRTELLQTLADAIDDTCQALVPRHSGLTEPLFAVYRKDALELINRNINQGNYKLTNLLSVLKTNYIDVEAFALDFLNINTPIEFENLTKSKF